ncbi:sugar-transfer associated ATP-grasp domain-containing protein [Siminovitchia sp. 179-K 8D1 HS]|uniref:sugar-transfer associated ATP-grasp domain-containing protein n=1 Tax=Siminovitchia sp. 179-K 8D1 HS TaxID=3142385 RepID=UPI0039A29BFE
MSLNYAISKVKKLWNGIDTYINPKLNWFIKASITLDFLTTVLLYGAGVNDYFQYKLYKRRHSARKDFVVYKKRMKIVKTFNDESDRNIFNSKERFNKVFKDYIGREWLSVKDSNLALFEEFTERVPKFIVKPNEGSHGKGIRVIEVENIKDKESLYEELKKEEVLIEELIIQHDELATFNPTSVNSLRVVTLFCPDNKVRVMTANLRMGNGQKYADNFHHNGIAALLDVETGIVVTKGVDRDLKEYITHPYTGKQIIGFKIPFWREVVETVSNAARLVPTVGYIGWDVAIGNDGRIFLIEGNSAADPDISQIPDQIGKWPLYKDFVKEKQRS